MLRRILKSRSGLTRHAAHAALAVALLTAGGCGILTSEPVPLIDVRTNATAYDEHEFITVTVRNRTKHDAYFFSCDHSISFIVQGQRGEGWEDVLNVDGPSCVLREAVITVLQTGSTYQRKFAMDEPGTYRLLFLGGRHYTSVGQDLYYSNEFTVQ